MVSRKRPTTPTATHVSLAWCRRSVPRDRSAHVCMSLARHKNHGVAGASRRRQRPLQSLLECAAPGRSSQCGTHSGRVQQTPWSHLECAAPGRSSQCGTAVSTKKKLRPSVLQTSEFREGILLPSITRRRLEHGIAHANSFDTSANPPMKPSQIGLPATASS